MTNYFSWEGAGTYAPPVAPRFTVDSIPPGGIGVPGIASTNAFGSPFVAARVRTLTAYTLGDGLAGGWVTQTYNLTKLVRPSGEVHTLYGTPSKVYNFNQQITTYPFTGQPLALGTPSKVYNALQRTWPGGVVLSAYGTPRVSNWFRRVYPSGWANSQTYGTAKVALYRRYLTSVYLPGTQTSFGTPFAAPGVRSIRPTGPSVTQFGTSTIRDRATKIRPSAGPLGGGFGVGIVKDRAQRLTTFGWGQMEFSVPLVKLYTRYLRPFGERGDGPTSSRFGVYTDVYNRNRYIHANGTDSAWLFSTSLVENKARAIYPLGAAVTTLGTAFVAYRVRSLPVEGWDGAYLTPYHVLRNRQKIDLDGWGWHSMVVPRPMRVWSNLQKVQPYSTTPMTAYGRAWLSAGQRVVEPVGIALPPEGYPFVAYRVRTITPDGLFSHMGIPALTQRWNKISAWGYVDSNVGTPAKVYNVIPEIRPYGAATYSAGRPTIQLYTRYLRPGGVDTATYSSWAYVAYRTRRLKPAGIPGYVSGNALVRFDQSQQTPPNQRLLVPPVKRGAGAGDQTDDYSMAVYGGGGSDPAMGVVTLKLHTIYAGGIAPGNMGTPLTRVMTIYVNRTVDSAVQLGVPAIYGGTKWVRLTSGIVPGAFGNTDVNGPQVIDVGRNWTEGPPPTWYAYDKHSYGTYNNYWAAMTVGPLFGGPTVMNKHRRVVGYTSQYDTQAQYGRPLIGTRPTRVYPAGFTGYKRGIPKVMTAGLQGITTYSGDMAVLGTPQMILQDYGPKWIRQWSIQGGSTHGTPWVSNKVRRVYPGGWLSQVSSTQRYVGPYLRLYPRGIDHASYGTPFVAYRVRRLLQLDVQDDTPMWVSARVKHEPRLYFINGSDFTSVFGNASVGRRTAVVYPSGWEEFQTGHSYVPEFYPGFSKLKTRTFVAAPSAQSMEFGYGAIHIG